MEPNVSPFPREVPPTSPPPLPSGNEDTEVCESGFDSSETVSDKARRKLNEVGSEVREQAHKLADKATEAAEEARRHGEEAIHEQKSKVSEHVSRYSSVVRGVAEKFREEENAQIAGYADQMADQLDRLAGYLSWRDINGLLDDTQDMARRRPDFFYGGMFVAGLALSRFLKASRPERRGMGHREPSRGEFAPAGSGQWQRSEVVEQSRSFEERDAETPALHPQSPATPATGFSPSPSPFGP